MDASLFDIDTGLGRLSVTVTTSGTHLVLAYFDHDIDAETNTFFNELGSVGGGRAELGNRRAGLRRSAGRHLRQLAERRPGQLHRLLHAQRRAMALGYDFILGAGDKAVITFFTSTVNEAPGFYLRHSDFDSGAELFFWSSLEIGDGGQPVPEPGSLARLGMGLLALAVRRSPRRTRQD